MTDKALAIFLSMIAGLWGYMVYREVWRGEFKRKGEWGWFSRKDHPGEFVFSLVLDSAYFMMMLAVIVWLLMGRPEL